MTTAYIPSKLQTAFSNIAFPEDVKALLAMQGNPQANAKWWDFHDGLYVPSWATVTQASSITTAVEINTLSGQIVTVDPAIAAGAEVEFQVNNSQVGARDIVLVNVAAGPADNEHVAAWVSSVSAGAFTVVLQNEDGGQGDGAMTLNFRVIKVGDDGIGGELTLDTNPADNAYALWAPGLHWKMDDGLYMIARGKIDNIATSKFEIGVTDALTDAGAVNAKATPTGTADDFAVLIRDTDDDVNLDFITELDNGGPVNNGSSGLTVANDTYFIAELRGKGDTISAYVNGQKVGDGSMQGGDPVTPWIFAQNRAGAARVLTVDFVGIYSPRDL